MKIKKYIFKKGAAKHIPVSGTFELTPRCNFSCEMCYIHMTLEEEKLIGTELSTQEWINLGKEAVDAGMIYLLLTGGEPLLRRDFCTIYTELAQMGVVLSLNTNGTLVTEKIIDCLSAHLPEKVNITLYGSSSETYQKLCGDGNGYHRALRGIGMLREAGIPISINTTFTKTNIADMDSIVSFAKQEKIPIRMSSYIFPPVRCTRDVNESCFLTPEDYGHFACRFDAMTMNSEQKKKRFALIHSMLEAEGMESGTEKKSCASSCLAGRGAFWVTWDGKILPCGMLPTFGSSLDSTGFVEIWKGMEQLMNNTFLPVECSQCNVKVICPICAAVSQSVYGDTTLVPKEMCRYTKAYVSAIMSDFME